MLSCCEISILAECFFVLFRGVIYHLFNETMRMFGSSVILVSLKYFLFFLPSNSQSTQAPIGSDLLEYFTSFNCGSRISWRLSSIESVIGISTIGFGAHLAVHEVLQFPQESKSLVCVPWNCRSFRVKLRNYSASWCCFSGKEGHFVCNFTCVTIAFNIGVII